MKYVDGTAVNRLKKRVDLISPTLLDPKLKNSKAIRKLLLKLPLPPTKSRILVPQPHTTREIDDKALKNDEVSRYLSYQANNEEPLK